MIRSVTTAIVLVAAVLMAVPAFAQQSGWIGVSIADQSDRGVLIRSVEPNSPAERAGLRANDVIVEYNKQDVVGVLQLTRLVSETPVGRTVDITVRRDNREQTFKVTSERAPFGIGPIHIQPPDVSAIRSRVERTIQPFNLLSSASVTQAGIRADSLTPQLREFFGVKNGEGVLVATVDENSAAAKAGLTAGDVITAVDGRMISSPSEFSREMRSRPASFALKVIRNKQEREIKIEK